MKTEVQIKEEHKEMVNRKQSINKRFYGVLGFIRKLVYTGIQFLLVLYQSSHKFIGIDHLPRFLGE